MDLADNEFTHIFGRFFYQKLRDKQDPNLFYKFNKMILRGGGGYSDESEMPRGINTIYCPSVMPLLCAHTVVNSYLMHRYLLY